MSKKAKHQIKFTLISEGSKTSGSADIGEAAMMALYQILVFGIGTRSGSTLKPEALKEAHEFEAAVQDVFKKAGAWPAAERREESTGRADI